jgi:hypothetical protein
VAAVGVSFTRPKPQDDAAPPPRTSFPKMLFTSTGREEYSDSDQELFAMGV